MAVKASERVKRYQNPNGPTISTVERKVIEQDGLYFKDIDGTGTVSAVNDWRLTPAERAEAYVKVLTTSEKIGQIFTSDWRMGPKYPSPRLAANGHKPVADESGLLDEAPVNVSDSIFGSQSLPSTSDMVKKSFNRHVILRETPHARGSGRLPEPAAVPDRDLRSLCSHAGHVQQPQRER